MATEEVTVRGKTKWFRHNAPNEWGKWTHVLYPDPESLEIVRDLQSQGIKNQVKKDDDGWYTTFSRATSILVKGKVVGLKPPLVTLPDGKPLVGVLVGNGSDVTTTLEVYQHRVPGGDKKAKAARWLATRIDNLVPYGSDNYYTPPEGEIVKKLTEQAAPLF